MRNQIVRPIVIFFLMALFAVQMNAQVEPAIQTRGKHLTITSNTELTVFKPLQSITVHGPRQGSIEVLDGKGDVYFSKKMDGVIQFMVGGALGTQQILLKNKQGVLIDRITFEVSGETSLQDKSGTYGELLDVLYWTMTAWSEGFNKVWVNDKFYHFFVCWLRDHVHTMKGMKYFSPELKTGIDLYADFQRNDGMIWDNIHRSTPEKNWWEKRFSYGDFYLKIEDGKYEFRRIPVENDVEYLFIEGIYFTWKATGDDAWMEGLLDKALKAVDYGTSDEYRWSEKYQLLKRGYTIDTWDFQTTEDANIAGGDIMVVYPDKTRFGVMFGDNTGMAAACNYLAEMLRYVGRSQEASEIELLGNDLLKRVNDLSWNGSFYTHHVPEDPSVERDLGVDESSQVSLSNAYSLNRGISHEKSVAIIKTYQKIRENMPQSSPGEWYTIYPPFERGFGKWDSSDKWEYMNGGVTSIVAGELAHGAFEHGFEAYGADILRRISELAQKTDNYLHCAYRGAMPEMPEREFTPLDIKDKANVVYPGKEAKRNGKWIGEDAVNGIRKFHEIPFRIPDPDASGKTGIEVTLLNNEQSRVAIDVDQKATSLYLLHSRENGSIAGSLTLTYEDGTHYTDYMTQDKVGFWWSEKDPANCKMAWRSNNEGHYIGLFVYGLNNPHPDKKIATLTFEGNPTVSHWRIAGVTLSDSPVFFMPSIVSHGIPDNWGAAAVTYGLIEGLVGIKDQGVAFNDATIAPRWEAAGEDEASVTIKYENSGAYISYQYKKSPQAIHLTFTGTALKSDVQVLLPEGAKAKALHVNGEEVTVTHKKIENSTYAVFTVEGKGVYDMVFTL